MMLNVFRTRLIVDGYVMVLRIQHFLRSKVIAINIGLGAIQGLTSFRWAGWENYYQPGKIIDLLRVLLLMQKRPEFFSVVVSDAHLFVDYFTIGAYNECGRDRRNLQHLWQRTCGVVNRKTKALVFNKVRDFVERIFLIECQHNKRYFVFVSSVVQFLY